MPGIGLRELKDSLRSASLEEERAELRRDA